MDPARACLALGLAALALAASAPARGQSFDRQTLWVFSDEVSQLSARQLLVDRSAESAVDDLYVSVYQPSANAAGRRMYPDADMADLVARAHAAGIAVWVAYGAPDWPALGCSPAAFPLQRMQEVLDYNNAHPSARFDGVALDVEPPDPQTPDELEDLLALHACIRDALWPAGVQVAAAIRHFWDTPVSWNGQTRPVYEHFIDLGLDHVVVLAYRDGAGTDCAGSQPDGSICLAEDEIAYASAQGGEGAILIGLETGDCAPGCGPEKVTFFEEGQGTLIDEVALVSAHYARSPGFGGFAVHRYGASYLGGGPGWPEHNPAWLGAPEIPALGMAGRFALAVWLLGVGLGRRARIRAS
jgi:hypothetical protein